MGTRVLTPILGSGLARAGEFTEALRILAPAVAAPLLPYCLNFVAEAYFLAGRPDEAARARPDSAAAFEHFRQALALAEEREMRPLIAHCNLGLGELLAAAGRPGEAQTPLTQAGKLYKEMGMTFWMKPAAKQGDGFSLSRTS